MNNSIITANFANSENVSKEFPIITLKTALFFVKFAVYTDIVIGSNRFQALRIFIYVFSPNLLFCFWNQCL